MYLLLVGHAKLTIGMLVCFFWDTKTTESGSCCWDWASFWNLMKQCWWVGEIFFWKIPLKCQPNLCSRWGDIIHPSCSGRSPEAQMCLIYSENRWVYKVGNQFSTINHLIITHCIRMIHCRFISKALTTRKTSKRLDGTPQVIFKFDLIFMYNGSGTLLHQSEIEENCNWVAQSSSTALTHKERNDTKFNSAPLDHLP